MTDDFQLFPDIASNDPTVDADAAVIVAYLARELSPVQVLAVEERLITDMAFRESVWPIMEGWFARRSFAEKGGTPVLAEPSSSTQRATRMRMARIAAVLAMIVLPMIAFAQVVSYVARHDVPGHALAGTLVARFTGAPSPSSIDKGVVDGGPTGSANDGPRGRQLSETIAAQQGVPVVDVTAPTGTTPNLGAVLGVVQTRDGRLLVNDVKNKQVHLFAPSLATSTLVLDSVPGSAKSYGLGLYAGVPFRGDSMLLVRGFGPPQQDAMLLDGRGQVTRAIDLSMAHDPGLNPTSQFFADPKGGLLYARAPGPHLGRGTPVELTCVSKSGGSGVGAGAGAGAGGSGGGGGGRGRGGGGGGGGAYTCLMETIWDEPDTVPVFRIDLDARRVDTVGYIARQPGQARGVNGGGALVPVPRANAATDSLKQVINPLQTVDDWAVLSDGTVAFVRGYDYHVDWIHPDGTKSASPKLPFEWKQLTDADKQRLVDSTRRVVDSLDASALRGGTLPKLDGPVPDGRGAPGRGAGLAFGAARPPSRRMFAYEIVPLSQIADYWPPFSAGAAKADADGNLWILPRMTSQSRQGELVYDVVNPKQGLVRRVRLPLGRSIAGFGTGGVVYLQAGNLANGFTIERVVVPR